MDELVRWLTACLDEDERIAREAARHAAAVLATAASKEGVWEPPYDGPEWENDYDHVFVMCDRPGQPRKVMIADCGHGAFMLTPHIAAHDPARVLREIEAKRALLRRANGGVDYPHTHPSEEDVNHLGRHHDDGLLRLLALPYADRLGYREEWAP